MFVFWFGILKWLYLFWLCILYFGSFLPKSSATVENSKTLSKQTKNKKAVDFLERARAKLSKTDFKNLKILIREIAGKQVSLDLKFF